MDAGANAPSVTYEIDGEQYISIYAAGNALAGSKHGDKVYTFKLGGSLPEGKVISAGKDSATVPVSTPEPSVAADVDKGLSIYTANCLACHGDQGANGHNGPNLQTSKFADEYDNVVNRITNGGTSMPSFEDTLSSEEIEAVAKYVSEIIAPKAK